MTATAPIDHFFEETDCPGCGAAETTPATPVIADTDLYGEAEEPYASMRFQYLRCTSCDTVYLHHRIRQHELAYFYNHEYHCYNSYDERGFVFKHLALMSTRAKVKLLTELFPSERRVLLDYGCGAGVWLELLCRAGVDWQLIVTEISETQIEAVRSLGLEGHVCDEDGLADVVKPESVGVIQLFHVIEHLPDPIDVLKKLAERLEPGGAIYGQTPNVDSWDCRLFGPCWSQWHVPRHLVLYTPETLAAHARAAGLEVKAIQSSMSGATGWANSLEKWIALRRGRDFMPSSSPLYPYLTLAAIPITILQHLFSWTSNIDFVFVKPRV